jgi:hypothetical protein
MPNELVPKPTPLLGRKSFVSGRLVEVSDRGMPHLGGPRRLDPVLRRFNNPRSDCGQPRSKRQIRVAARAFFDRVSSSK